MVMTREARGETGKLVGSQSCLDTRLVAAVQAAAGARCHRAANLLQTYYYTAETYRLALRRGDAAAVTAAAALLQTAKVRLRDFLAEQLLGWIAQSPERRLNRDHGQPVFATVSSSAANHPGHC